MSKKGLIMSESSFYKYFKYKFGNIYRFGKNHMNLYSIYTKIFALEEKLKDSLKLKQLEEIKMKYLDLRYSKWKKNTKLSEEHIERTIEEKSTETSAIENK